MANIKSAKKRIKVIDRRNEENKFVRATISTHRKNFKKFLAEKDLVNAEKKFKETEKLVYSAVSKGIFHQNKADRIVARMSAELYYAANNAAVEAPKAAPAPVVEAPAPVVVEEKKAPAKKATVKKAEKTEEAPAKATVKKTTTKKVAKTEEAPAKKAPAKTTAKKETAAKKTTTTAAKKTTAKKETK